MSRHVLVLVVAFALTGCDSSPSPVGPTTLPRVVPQASPQPAPPAPPTGNQVRGHVSDTAFRPLAGVKVEAISGLGAGTWTMTDANGAFSFTQTFDDTTQFRATKDGYLEGVRTRGTRCATCAYYWIYFPLALPAPPVSIAGDYSLTVIADSTCAALPSELRTRTYPATITPGSNPNIPANTYFDVTVSGASFHSYYNRFALGVAGDFLAFEIGGHGPGLIEVVAAKTYLAYEGHAEASAGTSPVTMLSMPFDGWISYCERQSDMGEYYDCGPGQPVKQAVCHSSQHQLILTRR